MPPGAPPVFFLDRPDPGAGLEELRALDPDRDWQRFEQGEEAWLLQTWLRLARAGFAAELTAAPAGGGLVLFHAKQKRALARRLGGLGDALLVGVRGDLRGSLALADVEIVQNAAAADGRRRRFVPHWPQPGLVPRDPARGDRLLRIAYKGYLRNLEPAFRSPVWARWLAELGVEWVVDAIDFAGEASDRHAVAWPDYRAIDAVLAVRPWGSDHPHKPASKLYNAWLAGTPALLGPEAAYRAHRADELDYLEVRSLEAARAAIVRLRAEPGLLRAMREHGFRRAQEFAVPATLARWRLLLNELDVEAGRPRSVLRRAARRLQRAWLGRGPG